MVKNTPTRAPSSTWVGSTPAARHRHEHKRSTILRVINIGDVVEVQIVRINADLSASASG